MERKVIFIDANHNKFTIEVEVKDGRFSASGDWGQSSGQCLDSIKPLNDAQKQLVDIWTKYHLNDMHAGTEKQEDLLRSEDFEAELEKCLDEIESLEEDRKGEPLDLEDDELIILIEEKTDFSGRDAELCAAFVKMFDLSENDLEDIEINDTRCSVQGVDYLAGDDEEMDSAWDENLENYIDECLEIPESMERYFDREAWKSDAKIDGRGHSLNYYDGGEEEEKINGTYYFAYRQ